MVFFGNPPQPSRIVGLLRPAVPAPVGGLAPRQCGLRALDNLDRLDPSFEMIFALLSIMAQPFFFHSFIQDIIIRLKNLALENF